MIFGSPPIVTNGLVLNLDAANMKSYPKSGTTWNDLSGFNNSGSLTNGPTFNSTNGGSIVFDGVDDYVSLGTSFSNLIISSTTISFWIYRSTVYNTSNTSTAESLFSMYTDDNNRGAVYFSNDTGYVGRLANLLVDGGGLPGRVYTQQNSWSIGWYNIVAVRAPSNYKIYVNGIDMPLTVVSNTATRAFTTNPIHTGIANSYYSTVGFYTYFPGNISNTLIYNRALSPSEVQQNYNAQKSRFNLQ